MTIDYTDNLTNIKPEQLAGFFVNWPRPPNAVSHLSILRNSYKAWLAMDGERCVGFINAISDGIFSAFIPLLEVLPEYQRRGIGSELARRMIASLADHYSIDVVCDQNVASFYGAHGFTPLLAMAKRNFERQNASSQQDDSPDACGTGDL